MMFSRLDVLDAFFIYDIFQLTVSLLGHNPIVSQGASALKVTELFTLKWLILVQDGSVGAKPASFQYRCISIAHLHLEQFCLSNN